MPVLAHVAPRLSQQQGLAEGPLSLELAEPPGARAGNR